MSSARHRRWPCIVVAAWTIALLVVGAVWHPIGVAGGEYGLYVERAERLLAGELANDPFHGMLYPELTALVRHRPSLLLSYVSTAMLFAIVVLMVWKP